MYIIGSIINNNYALNTMKVQNSNGDVTITEGNSNAGNGKSIEVLQSRNFYTTTGNWHNSEIWDIDSVTAAWKICDGEGLPFLNWQGIPCALSITATADANGSINPAGKVIVEEGSDITFTFIANNDYTISQVLVDDIIVPSAIISGKYTFENVTANHTIHVVFSGVGIEENITTNNIVIYPNPTTGKLGIKSSELKVERIEICDIYGRNVIFLTLPMLQETNVDISDLQSGIYFVRIHTERGEIVRKVLKE